MAEKKPPSIDLTVHLIKKDRDSRDSIIDAAGLIAEHTINLDEGTEGFLYIKKPTPNPPKWGKFFGGHVELREFGRGASPAAVLLVEIENRWFAITFGPAGRSLIDSDCTEERFGLLVVLNSIPETSVRSIDSTAFDARGTQSRVQTSQEASPEDFGLDIERDLVRAVTGTPSDESLGRRLHGMDALRATVNITIEQLPSLLAEYDRRHRSKIYKKNFGWIDQIAEVKDAAVRRTLDEKLVDHIHREEFDRCWMAVPEIIDWGTLIRFRYGQRKRNAKHHDIHLPAMIQEMNNISRNGFAAGDVDLQMLHTKRVMCITDDDVTRETWNVYKCLYAEVDYNRNSYLLSGGKWYCVSKDFVQEVNDYFAAIPRYDVALPEYNDESEGAYNERVASDNAETYALMDKKNIMYGGGPNRVEFCDLYTPDGDMIHVKRYGGSSVLSHLFAQGTTSGELFRMQSDFRALVNNKLPDSHKFDDHLTPPDRDEYQVVYAIISDQRSADLAIPFFSRLNLRSAANRLGAFGYRVAVTKVPVNRALAITKQLDAQ